MNNLNSILDYLKVFNNINKRKPYEPRTMAQGGGMMGQLVAPTVDGSRPGYSGKMKWTTKEVQEIYKDLPENVSVSKRTLPSGKTDYTYRAKISYKGKLYTFPSKVATPENKKQLIKDVETKWDKLAPNRISREEYTKLRLLPENRRLSGEDFAKKLNEVYKKTTYRGDKWNNQNVYNYDLEAPRSKTRIAKDLGFFEKRTVAEAKELIKTFSGGKDFLKNKNLTDADITTKAASYIAQEKHLDKSGGTHFPHGRQNKRKVWKNIYESHTQNGRFKLVNGDELAGKDGKINWKKDQNWRKAKFKDSKSGKIFTYGNVEEMVNKHGGGWNKAIKAYDDNAKLHQMTFKGKSLNDWFREGMIKKEYEAKLSKGGKKVKVTWNDKDFKNYLGRRKKGYGFAEAHHYKGVKDHPFDTESSFRYANRRQGNIQNSYNKAIKSGNPDRIAKAKIKYAEDMTNLSDEMGGIKFKTEGKFFGKSGTPQTIIKAGVEASGIRGKNRINILNAFCGKGSRKKFGIAGTVEGLTCSMDEIQGNIKKQTNEALKFVKDGKIPKKFAKLRSLGMLFGWVDAPIELMFAAPYLISGDIEGAKRATTAGIFGWGKVDLDKISDEDAKRYLKHTKAMNDYMNNYGIAIDAENRLKDAKLGTGDHELTTQQFENAQTNMDDIQATYQDYGYTYEEGDTPIHGKVAAQKYIREKVKSDFENKIENIASNETFKDADQELLKEQLRDLGGRPEKATPITDLESYMRNKGEEMAGNTNLFFNVEPYVLEEAEALGVPEIFDDYALGAGVEGYGRKSLQDAYSEIPLEYAGGLAALEKKQLEEGLKKKKREKILESPYLSQGGIASLKKW